MTKRDWLLLLLKERAFDRIRLMKALFLIWHRSDRNIPGFYEFVPYMYGPCSFDLYRELESAERERLVAQAPHPILRWAPYFLTELGHEAAARARQEADPRSLDIVQSLAAEVASLGFSDLLRRVYSEAPEFATNSVVG